MIPGYVNQRNVQKRKYIRTIHARAEAARNTNSAAEENWYKEKEKRLLMR